MLKSLFCTAILLVLVSPLTSVAQNLLDGPEHATYDVANDRYLISNWRSGDIVAIDNEGTQSYFITHLPHALGNHIVGDTFYVSIGSIINAYDLNSGAILWYKNIAYADQIDGIAADTSGYLYFAEMNADQDGRIFRFQISDQTSHVYVNTDDLPKAPQDIIFDEVNNRLLVASYAKDAPLVAVDLSDASVSDLVITPFGYSDGIAMDNDGNVYMTCYSAGTVYRYDNTFTNPPTLVSSGHSGPAGLGYNPIDNILAVPNFSGDRVDFIPLIDTDDDGIIDHIDNCLDDPNPDQSDRDEDGDGDVCDGCPDDYNPEHEDTDGDGVEDACDNCPDDYNPGQEDSNGNDVGDVCDYICGDGDGDRVINILDIVFLINYIYKSGTAPEPLESVDVNSDLQINILDVVYLINFIYKSGAEPVCP